MSISTNSIGCYASDINAKSYEKVPPSELIEIDQNESDLISTNSMRFSMALRTSGSENWLS